MSENLDLVRSIYAEWEHGDFSSTAWAHPEIEFTIADGPEPRGWTGVARTREGASTTFDVWADWRPQAEAYRELDDERVLVLTRRRARGTTSGVQVCSQAANLFHLRGDEVIRIAHCSDRDRALADLGLEG